MAYNFNFSFLKNGSPVVTLSAFGIAFNKGAIEALGTPEEIVIGFDQKACAIGVRAKGEDGTSPSYEFARRIKNDWIRVELKEKGYLTISGRVNKQYFMEKTCYGTSGSKERK